MTHDDEIRRWARSRAEVDVPDRFTERVIDSIAQRERLARPRDECLPRWVAALLGSRTGRIAVAVAAGVFGALRLRAAVEIFVP